MTIFKRLERLESGQWGAGCPECHDWPDQLTADQRLDGTYTLPYPSTCPRCGRSYRPKVYLPDEDGESVMDCV